jgi:heat shock protein HslJ
MEDTARDRNAQHLHDLGRGWPHRARGLLIACCVALAALTLAPALAGCSLLPGSGPALDGTTWRLTGWSLSFADPHDFDLTAAFDDGRISGNAAANSYAGAYAAQPDGGFKVGALTLTEKGGEPRALQAQDGYLELLKSARTYKLTNGALRLYDANGNDTLIFSAVQP